MHGYAFEFLAKLSPLLFSNVRLQDIASASA